MLSTANIPTQQSHIHMNILCMNIYILGSLVDKCLFMCLSRDWNENQTLCVLPKGAMSSLPAGTSAHASSYLWVIQYVVLETSQFFSKEQTIIDNKLSMKDLQPWISLSFLAMLKIIWLSNSEMLSLQEPELNWAVCTTTANHSPINRPRRDIRLCSGQVLVCLGWALFGQLQPFRSR